MDKQDPKISNKHTTSGKNYFHKEGGNENALRKYMLLHLTVVTVIGDILNIKYSFTAWLVRHQELVKN